MRSFKTLLVTGGAGFIGSHLIGYLLGPESGFTGRVVNLDNLTYAANLQNLAEVETTHGKNGSERYVFERGDICDQTNTIELLTKYEVDAVVNLAAESHVDRSIDGPEPFMETNAMGTFRLLEACRLVWGPRQDVLFHQVSTDEVYGSLGEVGYFMEKTPYDPHSPYSASKAAGDHLAMAYFHTYNLPVTITNSSNNYGPCQYPEKLIPVIIHKLLGGRPVPLYGDGKNIRDWLYVSDHARAIWLVMQRGRLGERYNVGGESERENLELAEEICQIVAQEIGSEVQDLTRSLTFVNDRPGHDRRYALDCRKIKTELGWSAHHNLAEGLRKTVQWYLSRSSKS